MGFKLDGFSSEKILKLLTVLGKPDAFYHYKTRVLSDLYGVTAVLIAL